MMRWPPEKSGRKQDDGADEERHQQRQGPAENQEDAPQKELHHRFWKLSSPIGA
jgi:hypothetical protein